MPETVSFYSFKGGVGRSVALANVAVLLARRGKRVVCIDFDLEAGGLHTIFNADTHAARFTLLDLLCAPGIPDVERSGIDLSKKVGIKGDGGRLWLLPTISEPRMVNRALEAKQHLGTLLGTIIQQAESVFFPNYVLVDARAGFAELAAAPLREAERVVCVLRPNRQNTEGLRLLLDIIDHLRDPPDTFLVLSQVPDLPETRQRVADFEQLLGNGRRFDASIPYAPQLALDERVETLMAPESTLARSYEPIAEWLENGAKG